MLLPEEAPTGAYMFWGTKEPCFVAPSCGGNRGFAGLKSWEKTFSDELKVGIWKLEHFSLQKCAESSMSSSCASFQTKRPGWQAAVGMGHTSRYPLCVAGKLRIVGCCGEQRGAGEAGGPMGGGAVSPRASVCLHVLHMGTGISSNLVGEGWLEICMCLLRFVIVRCCGLSLVLLVLILNVYFADCWLIMCN